MEKQISKGEIYYNRNSRPQCSYCRHTQGQGINTRCVWCKRIRRILEDTVPKVRINGDTD